MKFSAVFFMAAMFSVSEASAQTSNCMAMGGNMVHCDNMGPNGSTSSTNCMGMGPDMASCQTTGLGGGTSSGGDPTGAMVLQQLGSLFGRINEGAFRKHVKQMLANGDCQGAANYAFAKGKLDMGKAITESCQAPSLPQPSRAMTPGSPDELAAMLQRTASAIPTPIHGDDATLVRAEPVGNQLLLTTHLDTPMASIPIDRLTKAKSIMCANEEFTPLLQNGASVRLIYVSGGREINSVMVTRQICGL